jgi:hypothetical protein
MRTLLEIPVFRAMMRRRPKLGDHLVHPVLTPPWTVWVITNEEKWRRRDVQTYDEAYRLMRAQLDKPTVSDVAIVCKRRQLPPPEGFTWDQPWCPRCRRPTMFSKKILHRALKGHEITFDEPIRCFYCGIREVAVSRWSYR